MLVGSKAELRLLHIFEMRDGKISRELVFESWKVVEEPARKDDYVVISVDYGEVGRPQSCALLA